MSATALPSRPAGVGLGIGLYSFGILFFAVNDALGKWLIADYGAGQLMAMRSLGAAPLLALMMWRYGMGSPGGVRGQIGLHVLRVVASAGDTFCFYYATRALPLAEVLTFYLAAPVIIVALSAVLLGERVGPVRWLAVLCGFGGVVIVLQPGAAALSPSALLAVLGAALFALTITVTRRLRDTNWLTLTALQFGGSGLIGALMLPVSWVTPPPSDLLLMFAVGVTAMLCHMAIIRALSLAPASLLAPLQYASVIWGALIGWAIWGDVPGAATVLGVAVIAASGLVALRPDRSTAKPADGLSA